MSSTRPRPPSRSGSTPLAPSDSRSMLYAQPASVHFSGFTLDSSAYTQRLLVHNNSAKPVRLQYTLPCQSAGVFRASFPQPRKPFLSPGLDEELLITFKPGAYQYYYDCVQVKCEQVAYASNADVALLGKLLVPLHAYPVVNRVEFPTRMDFGAVPLGTTVRRHVDLACSVPIEFEFELRVVKPHAAFTVFPLRGAIPANGSARIEFEFKPLLFATASAEVELHVAQLGFQPQRCSLTGSSASDLSAEASAATGASSSPTKRSQRPRTGDTTTPASPHAQPKPSPSRPPKSPSKQTKRTGDDAKRQIVNGIEIPEDLSSTASVNFVLTQQPGKLKPKDLKKAIDANRAMRQQQKDEQAKLAVVYTDNDATNQEDEVVSPAVLNFHVLLREEASAIQRAGVSRQIREMFFLQELSEIETIEKELEFQSHTIRLGQELLTPEQLEIVQQMRELNARELARRERERLRHAVTTSAFHMFTQPTPEMPYPPRGMLPAQFHPAITPDFKSYKNDLWDRRKRVVQRLVRAISTVIIRNRAQSRLDKLHKWLGNARTREQVRDQVAREWQALANGGGSSGSPAQQQTHATKLASHSSTTEGMASIYLESFPMVEEKDHRTRELIPLAPGDWDLQSDPFKFFPLRERDEALVAGHEPLELPPLPTYMPLENTRALRHGALDECSLAVDGVLETEPSSSYLPPQELRIRSTLEMLPRDVFLRPSAAVRPLVRINSTRETLVSFPLRPQRVFRSTPRHWGLELDTGIGTRSLRSLRTGLLRMHDRYQPRTERARGVQPLLLCGQPDESSASHAVDGMALYRGVWDASDGFVPPMSTHADDVPCLSDSESDDEESDVPADGAKGSRTRPRLPTWQDALKLWEDSSEEDDDDDDDGVAYEPGELLGKAQGITCFERYRHLIQSEREYNAYRDEKLQQLPTLLTEVANKIHHPDYEIVVEGHGPSRPLHEPFATVFARAEAQLQSTAAV